MKILWNTQEMEPLSLSDWDSMSEVEQILGRLKDAGLATFCDNASGLILVGIARSDLDVAEVEKKVRRWERDVFVELWDFDPLNSLLVEDTCVLWNANGAWVFRNSTGFIVGCETLHAVRCNCLSAESAAETAISYLLQPPLRFHHWLIPVFQYPTWNVEGVARSLASSREVHYCDALLQVELARANVSFSEETYEWKNKDNAYIRFDGQDEKWRRLYLRYDLMDSIVTFDWVERNKCLRDNPPATID